MDRGAATRRSTRRLVWTSAFLLTAGLVFAQARDIMTEGVERSRGGEEVSEEVEEELDREARLFDGPDFGVIHPELRDGALNFTITPWASSVYLPYSPVAPPVGPPWWNPGAHPPGMLIFVY